MDQQINLTICQECKEEPAIYGDGLTWSRCSGCQLKKAQQEQIEQPESQPPVADPSTDSFEHQIVPGLTSIIVPVYMLNYALFHYTGNCIGSVREHTPEGTYELLIVDNGSAIQPPGPESYYAHKVIKNEKNLGVTKAWNQGIRMSTGEYIVLLNNDVQVFDGWLEGLRENLVEYDLVMAHPMYSKTEPFARAVEAKKIKDAVIASPNILSGFKDFSCVMMRRSLFDELGLFDERFFNYCSDSDFFDRMKEAGKKWACIEYVPTSHLSDATGYSMPDVGKIMDIDKETYAKKQEEKKFEVSQSTSNTETQIVSEEWSPPVVPPKKEGELVRSSLTGDAIYFKGKDKKWHHITSPEVLHALGFDFGQEKLTDSIDEIGDDITMSNYKEYE